MYVFVCFAQIYNLPLIMRVVSFFDASAINADAATDVALLTQDLEIVSRLRSLRKMVRVWC